MRTNILFAAFAAAVAVTASRAEAQFTPVPHSMTTARSLATATLLPNGKVLIAGGSNGGYFALSTAELYDPSTGVFTASHGMMFDRRYSATATLLSNGKVLIVGGAEPDLNETAEAYDPTSDTFTEIDQFLNEPRYAATATLLPSGKVLIAGGELSGYLSSAELFDPATSTFTLTSNSMAVGRAYATATLLPDGRVLIAGGLGDEGVLSSAELYDPTTDSFTTPAHSMTVTRENATATLLRNGKVLITGGDSGGPGLATAELYDPEADTFVSTAHPMTAPRTYATATLMPSGKVMIAGGFNGSSVLSSAELYDPDADAFTVATNSMSAAREAAMATLLPDGRVLVVGGYNGSGYSSSADIYDPATANESFSPTTNTLTEAGGSLPTATLLSSGKVLVAGGLADGAVLSGADLYDPATKSFTESTHSMTVGRTLATATLLQNGKVLIAGGSEFPGGILSSAELYDPVSDTFGTTANSMTGAREIATATLLPNGKVLIAGGVDEIRPYAHTTADLYDPATNSFSASTNSMISTHYMATATLLPNGKVLIAGDYWNFFFSSPELYDPDSDTFTPTSGPMTTRRYGATATLLRSGKVLIAGGGGATNTLASAELYDPDTETFSPTANPMTTARYRATATLMPDGRVLIVGGEDDISYLSSAEFYDPASDSFTAVSESTTDERYSAAATLLPNGQVLVTGGYNGVDLLSADVFDPGLGVSTADRPIITSITSPMLEPGQITVQGAGFRASTQEPPGAVIGSEASGGGTTSNSATNYPLLQLQRIDNDQQFFVPLDESGSNDWTDTSCITAQLSGLPIGYYRATVFVNAVPSQESVVLIEPPAFVSGPASSTACAGSSVQLTLTINGVSTSIPAAISIDWGDGGPLDVETVSSVPVEFHHNVVPVDDGSGPVGISYNITVSDSNGSLAVSGSPYALTVAVRPLAVVGPNGLICSEGGSYRLSGSGAGSCSWFPSTGLDDPNSCTPLATLGPTTIYTLTVSDVVGCPSMNNPVVVVSVGDAPSSPSLGQYGCLPGELAMNLSASGDPSDTLTWTISGASIVSGQGTNTIRIITPPAGSIANVSVVETTPLGCASVPATSVIASEFADIAGNAFESFICDIEKAGVTAGCGNGNYCPTSVVTRDTMAVFLLRAEHGGSYTPPACVSPVFNDVPCSNNYSAWINQFAAEGITAGCGGGDYCPLDPVTRDTMAVFILRTEHGGNYMPPGCGNPFFADVPCSNIYAPWIDQLFAEEVTSGCGNDEYCPTAEVTREEMAKFLDLALLNRP